MVVTSLTLNSQIAFFFLPLSKYLWQSRDDILSILKLCLKHCLQKQKWSSYSGMVTLRRRWKSWSFVLQCILLLSPLCREGQAIWALGEHDRFSTVKLGDFCGRLFAGVTRLHGLSCWVFLCNLSCPQTQHPLSIGTLSYRYALLTSPASDFISFIYFNIFRIIYFMCVWVFWLHM